MSNLLIVINLLLYINSNISYGLPAKRKDILFGRRNYTIDKVLYDANKSYGSPDNVNPEELGSYFEGDLIKPNDVQLFRTGLNSESSVWPGGLVPYEFEGVFKRNEIHSVLQVFGEFSALTCIQFYPRSIELDYISVQKSGRGCFSSLGRTGGMQVVNFDGSHCFRHGTIIHELMHALGFEHEQKRYDRDEYIKVKIDNVKDGRVKNFQKRTPQEVRLYGIPYDYGSVLHYSRKAFSKNGKDTIIPLKKLSKDVQIGQRIGFSPYDLDKIRARYKCTQQRKKMKKFELVLE